MKQELPTLRQAVAISAAISLLVRSYKMKYTYEIEIGELSKVEVLKRTDENGIVSFIPMDEANSDYQAYLASLEAPTA